MACHAILRQISKCCYRAISLLKLSFYSFFYVLETMECARLLPIYLTPMCSNSIFGMKSSNASLTEETRPLFKV